MNRSKEQMKVKHTALQAEKQENEPLVSVIRASCPK